MGAIREVHRTRVFVLVIATYLAIFLILEGDLDGAEAHSLLLLAERAEDVVEDFVHVLVKFGTLGLLGISLPPFKGFQDSVGVEVVADNFFRGGNLVELGKPILAFRRTGNYFGLLLGESVDVGVRLDVHQDVGANL